VLRPHTPELSLLASARSAATRNGSTSSSLAGFDAKILVEINHLFNALRCLKAPIAVGKATGE
ncbi:MAG: hypothetical protein ACR2N1_03330, partial [Rubripirellula sp.]